MHEFRARRDGRCQVCGRVPRGHGTEAAADAPEEATAPPSVSGEALAAVEGLAMVMSEFTSGAVYALVDEPHAMIDAALTAAAERGWVRGAGPRRWRSLIVSEGLGHGDGRGAGGGAAGVRGADAARA